MVFNLQELFIVCKLKLGLAYDILLQAVVFSLKNPYYYYYYYYYCGPRLPV